MACFNRTSACALFCGAFLVACGANDGDAGSTTSATTGAGGASTGSATGGSDTTSTSAGSGGSEGVCVADYEVTLPGHEGQFFGTPELHCQTFVTGTPNAAFVVVGTDVAATGDHDCTLDRPVRYHVDWGDGTCSWTEVIERCDVAVGVSHVYDTAGTYTADVFAEDEEGRRTRRDDKTFEVVDVGGDAYVQVTNGDVAANTVTFDQTVGLYGNLDESELVIAYRHVDCMGVETELERRTVSLPAPVDGAREVTAPVSITLPVSAVDGRLIIDVDPDETVAETCPPAGNPPSPRGINNLAAVEIAFCGF